MSILILLLGISLGIALFFLIAFIWSVHGGQFDDPVTPAMRMLHDDETDLSEKKKTDNTDPEEPTV